MQSAHMNINPKTPRVNPRHQVMAECLPLPFADINKHHQGIPMSVISKRFSALFTAAVVAAVAFFGATAPSAADPIECIPTVTTEGEYTVLTFNTPGDCTWTAPADVSTIQYIVVGAGGGGGAGGARIGSCDLHDNPSHVRFGGGGAGGAGGEVLTGTLEPTAGNEISVSVGAGGAGGYIDSVCPTGGFSSGGTAGDDGGVSVFDDVVAIGGGAGDGGTDTGAGGANGGSLGALFTGGINTQAADDCNYTTTTGCFAAPGGAGAGENGFDPSLPDGQENAIWTNGGNGGAGVDVNGVYFGGGGGGATRHCYSNPTGTTRHGGTGGLGGGGNGALVGCPVSGGGHGDPGIDNLGGGGGGGRGNGSSAAGSVNAGLGGKGGDGVVIIRYIPIPENPVVTGETSEVTKDGAKLNWTTTDGDRVTEYKVLINGVLVDTITAPATSYDVTNLRANKQYVVRVVPVISGTDYTAFVTAFHTPATKWSFVNFEPFRYRLQATQAARIKAVFDSIPEGSTNITVTITGHVKKLGNGVTATDRKLVAGRAKVVRWAFTKLGLNATYVVKSDLAKSVTFNYGRRADFVITYTPPVVLA